MCCLFYHVVFLPIDHKDAGSVVVEKDLDSSDVGQQWERSSHDDLGFFTLKNPNSGLFLTMKTANKLTIGIAQYFLHCCCFIPCFFLHIDQILGPTIQQIVPTSNALNIEFHTDGNDDNNNGFKLEYQISGKHFEIIFWNENAFS